MEMTEEDVKLMVMYSCEYLNSAIIAINNTMAMNSNNTMIHSQLLIQREQMEANLKRFETFKKNII
ncbi:hypothetical protein [Vagococcus intermedius]|uniref:Uncharacterized protein n=1 Tax=Vagococcus intermedius TaxID=2991418 RepID=A0AAF0CVC2_9ENTE|nr:hypothetical protein [Vagococcus intermedius]WEG73653.1 hypothetical protein OL234_01730 [Vagococcus intermedius]WEG75737.1 hypothetical protein OL235_01740 [Vagococcus intermedius]